MNRKTSRKGKSKDRGAQLVQRLVKDAPQSFTAWHVPEPKLVFGAKNLCEDPKTGITIFGPAALDHGARSSIRLGLIGTGETIGHLRRFLDLARGQISAGRSKRGKAYDPLLSPDFPGFDMDRPFRCRAEISERLTEELTGREIERAISSDDYQTRVKNVADLISEKLTVVAERDPEPDVVICAMPENVDIACGPKARDGQRKRRSLTRLEKATRRIEKEAAKTGQMFLSYWHNDDNTEDKLHWDFHNAMKIRAMKANLTTQLIWEGTLTGTRETQDRATLTWNFFTALYYKAGNLPWELPFPATDTCFVGVSFYRESREPDSITRSSLAQVFSDSGEGLVLKGEPVTWDRERDYKPHLSESSAFRLLSRAINLYKNHFDRVPRRVVLHKTSRFWDEELDGFRSALEDIHSYDFVALERRGIRFLRLGKEPPIRGTAIRLAQGNYFLYTRGYIPFFKVYPGMRVPNPLEIVEHIGDSSPEKICSELMALTKLNWNNCNFGSGDPITIAFSREVGRILTELPKDQDPKTKYRFYM